MILYITREQAEITHLKTVELSGGGSTGVINIGYLDSVLEHIQKR
jgi:death-on-curing protein